MQVTIHFTTQLRQAIGCAQRAVDVTENATVGDALRQLAAEHADAFHQFVLSPEGRLLPSIIVCVNDAQVASPDHHVLTPGAQVVLLSAISGG